MPHPAVQILLWLSLSVLLQRLPLLLMMIFSLLLLAFALKLCAKQLLKLLKRTRWIMLSLLIIYSYATPGTALIAPLGEYAPGYPLRWIGIDRERAAVRLALTLQYAEPTMGETAADWRGAIRHALKVPAAGTGHIELHRPHWHAIDGVGLLCSAAMLWLGLR